MDDYFETIYVPLDPGQKMAADVIGAGEAVLLIHGIPGGPNAWHHVAAELGQSYRVVIPHLLGFKGSSRPEKSAELWTDAQARGILKVCDDLGVNRAVLVGHDFGGPVAARLLELRPHSWTHLALFSANTFRDTPIPPPLSFTLLPIVGPVFQKLLFSKPALAMMLKQGVGRPGISLAGADYLGDVEQVRSIATIFTYALTNLASLYPPIEQALGEYSGPALVGWGDRDPFFTVDQGRRTAALVGGDFSLYQGAGHFTPEECVAEIVADLHTLVAGADSGPSVIATGD